MYEGAHNPRINALDTIERMGFSGLRVLALESRRAAEMGQLIGKQGGDPFVAPSMREMPLADNAEAFEFAEQLFHGEFDMVVLLTGVGTRQLHQLLATRYPENAFAQALSKVTLVARGPKPAAALRELGLTPQIVAPEPNTWRELLANLDENKETLPLARRRVAVQEYGVTNPELSGGLADRGAIVTLVNVYHWALPENLAPLEQAIESIIRGDVHVLLVASSVQIRHLFEVAERMKKAGLLHEALSGVVITSVGPLTSEELRGRGLSVDIECTHPKMGFLVQEAAERAPELLKIKRPHSTGKLAHP